MRIVRLTISHFRSVRAATLDFNDHTLFIGPNNVGKSTMFEAMDLVLSPDRLSRFPPLEEFDFYNAEYLTNAIEGQPEPKPLRVQVLLTNLTPELQHRAGAHLEFWLEADRRILSRGEADLANSPQTVPCLRLETVGQYNIEEDEFEAHTYFSHGNVKSDGSLETVSKSIKRLIGFVYLRTLRTGTRALSLGSRLNQHQKATTAARATAEA